MIQDKKSKMANVNRTYRHKVEVLDYVSYENELLQNEQILMPIMELYVDIKPIRGRELTESSTLLLGETTYRITAYYRPEVKTDMYLKWGERYLQIESIFDVSGREMHMEIMAKEVQKPSGSGDNNDIP